MSKKIKIYSEEERLSILTDYYSSGMSKGACVRKYNLCGSSLLNTWIRKYECSAELLPLRNDIAVNTMVEISSESESLELRSLQSRISDLEKALSYSKMETLSRDVLIDKAEEYYNIPIRKKSGVKQ